MPSIENGDIDIRNSVITNCVLNAECGDIILEGTLEESEAG